jgi:membrane-associated protease RseP (regulator of RpoE activity)
MRAISVRSRLAPELRCTFSMIDAYRISASPPLVDTPVAPPPATTLHVARDSPTATALLAVASIGLGVLLAWGRGAPAATITTVPMAAAPTMLVMPPLPALAQNAAPTRPILTSSPPSTGAPSSPSTGAIYSAHVPSPPAILSMMGVATHDPAQLLARARKLAGSGADVRVLEVEVPSIVMERAKARGNDLGASSMVPFEERGKTIGLRLGAVRANSPLAHAGFESNDIVVAVNGYAVENTTWYDAALRKTGTKSLFVVEVIRSGERVVLAVHWTA